MPHIIPVFRAFDYQKTIEFYINWLGFNVNWTHKPDDAPFYMQVSIRGVALDLSEHHGECSPGAKICIVDFEGLQDYHRELMAKPFIYMNPALERFEWQPDTLTMTVIDPFSNRIIFTEKVDKGWL